MSDRCYASNYLNVYKSHRETSILFNGFTGTIDEVSPDLGALLSVSSRDDGPISREIMANMSDSVIAFLKKRGHITPLSHFDEIEKFGQYVDKLHKALYGYSDSEGSLMLVPSYDCNLRCSYCYQGMLRCGHERKIKHIMTVPQVDRLFQNLLNQLFPKVSSLSKVSINLYGGEPFLLSSRKVLERAIHYTTKYQMKVSAISNATQLHKMPHLFGNRVGLVNNVQISFDGDKECHDVSRTDHLKTRTFDRILENIHLMLNKRVRIGVRVNISKESVRTLPLLIERLKSEDILGNPLVRVYAWVIHSHYNQVKDDKLLSPLELADYMAENQITIETPVGRRERRLQPIFEAKTGIPLRRISFCMKTMRNAYVYDLYDNIYSCYEEAGHIERKIGCVDSDGQIIIDDAYQTFLKRHVASIESCKCCSLALTCGGGCPFAAEQKCGTIYAPDCDCHKECVEKAIQNIFRKKTELSYQNKADEQREELYPYA